MFASVKSTDVDNISLEKNTKGKEQKIQTKPGEISVIAMKPSRPGELCFSIRASNNDFGRGDDPDCKEKEALIIFTVNELAMIVTAAAERGLVDFSRIPQVREAIDLLHQASSKLESVSIGE